MLAVPLRRISLLVALLSTFTLSTAARANEDASANESASAPSSSDSSGKVAIEALDIEQLMAMPLDYGFSAAKVQTHLYLTTALWSLGSQAYGDFADQGGGLSGHPNFVTYSGYVDVRGQITDTLMAEAELELYKGQDGATKVTRLRGVWRPNPYFQLSLGRDFPPIGVEDKVYYPTSEFRLFSHAPYLYHAIMRATGWWDSGVHLSGSVPLPFLGHDAALHLAASVINGPGDAKHDGDYLEGLMKPDDAGYMFESFHGDARQPWDNNSNKAIPFRVSLSPIKAMEVGGSAMVAKYGKEDRKRVLYTFGHFLYGGKKLTVAAEFGQIVVGVNPANMENPAINGVNGTFGDKRVTQRSWYASAGYKLFEGLWGLQYIEPVVRYETVDSWVEDTTNKGDRQLVWAGARVAPLKGWVIKAAYMWQWEEPKLDNDGFIVESVFQF